MIVDVGIVEGPYGSRLAVAFVASAYVRPGPGDELLHAIQERLRYLTPAPLMLYSEDGRGYAPFQAHQWARRLRREHVVEWIEVDLARPWEAYLPEPEF